MHAGKIGGNDQGGAAAVQSGGNPVQRRVQRGDATVAGVLRFEIADVGLQAQGAVDVGADGLAEIHRALGADHEHPDGIPVDAVQHRAGRVGTHCHRVLVQRIQRARVDQEIGYHLLGVHAPCLGQFLLIQDQRAAIDVDLFYSNAAHSSPQGA